MILEQKNEYKLINKTLYIISFIPFLIYPFLLLANIMSLFGYKSGNTPFLNLFITYSFLIISTLYPITFFYSKKNRKNNKIIISLLPLFHIIISVILCSIWLNLEN
jgi:hypothetical protein